MYLEWAFDSFYSFEHVGGGDEGEGTGIQSLTNIERVAQGLEHVENETGGRHTGSGWLVQFATFERM